MVVATVSEAKNRLSALIARARGGESTLIVDRGVPVARLEPAVTIEGDADGRIERLARAGGVRAAAGPPSVEALSGKPPRPRQGASGVRALLEERRSDR